MRGITVAAAAQLIVRIFNVIQQCTFNDRLNNWLIGQADGVRYNNCRYHTLIGLTGNKHSCSKLPLKPINNRCLILRHLGLLIRHRLDESNNDDDEY